MASPTWRKLRDQGFRAKFLRVVSRCDLHHLFDLSAVDSAELQMVYAVEPYLSCCALVDIIVCHVWKCSSLPVVIDCMRRCAHAVHLRQPTDSMLALHENAHPPEFYDGLRAASRMYMVDMALHDLNAATANYDSFAAFLVSVGVVLCPGVHPRVLMSLCADTALECETADTSVKLNHLYCVVVAACGSDYASDVVQCIHELVENLDSLRQANVLTADEFSEPSLPGTYFQTRPNQSPPRRRKPMPDAQKWIRQAAAVGAGRRDMNTMLRMKADAHRNVAKRMPRPASAGLPSQPSMVKATDLGKADPPAAPISPSPQRSKLSVRFSELKAHREQHSRSESDLGTTPTHSLRPHSALGCSFRSIPGCESMGGSVSNLYKSVSMASISSFSDQAVLKRNQSVGFSRPGDAGHDHSGFASHLSFRFGRTPIHKSAHVNAREEYALRETLRKQKPSGPKLFAPKAYDLETPPIKDINSASATFNGSSSASRRKKKLSPPPHSEKWTRRQWSDFEEFSVFHERVRDPRERELLENVYGRFFDAKEK